MQTISNKSPLLPSVNARRLLKCSLLAVAFATTSLAQDIFHSKGADAQPQDAKLPVKLEERRDPDMNSETEMAVSSTQRRRLASADCVYESDPTNPEITLHFKPGEVVKLEDEFAKAFKWIRGTLNGVVDEENCPVTHIYKYDSPVGGDVTPVLLADETYTIPDAPGSSTLFFGLGSEVAKTTNVLGAKLTTCGNEEIAVVEEAPYQLALTKFGQNELYVLHDTVFEKWFVESFPVDGFSSCVIEKYYLVDEAGELINKEGSEETSLARMSPHYNDFIHQDLLVSLKADVPVPQRVYLQAKTLGQKVARRAVDITVDTTVDKTDGPCLYSITPGKANSAAKYHGEKELVVNLANIFKQRFTLATSNPEACKIDQVEVFTGVIEDPEQGLTYVNRFVPKSFSDFTVTAKEPGTERYFFRVSSSSSTEAPSNVVESDVTVCGRETIAETTPGVPQVLSYVADGALVDGVPKTLEEVAAAAYTSWFTLDQSASSALCGIEKLEVVTRSESGEFVPLEKVKGYAIAQRAAWLDAPLQIDLRQDQTNLNTVYLQATTMGDQVARKQLSISVTAFRCTDRYTATNNDAVVAVPYQESKEIEVYGTLNAQVQFATSDEAKCPIDQLTLYADSSDYPDTPASRPASLPRAKLVMENKTKGTNKYYMSVGSKANGFKSALFTGTIVVCGLEQIRAVSDETEAISVEQGGSEATLKIELATYQDWFKTETGDQSSSACLDITYKLVKQNGLAYNDVVDDPIIDLAGGRITIAKALTTVTPYKLYLQATTKGGQVARKQLAVSTPCAYTTEAISEAPKAVLPFVNGGKVDTMDYLKQQWKFATNDAEPSNANCPIDKVYTYASQADYEAGTVLQQGGFDSIDFNMEDSRKGKNEIFFSVGGDAAAAKKNLATGTIIICGKELLTLEIAGSHEYDVKKDTATPGLTKVVEAEEISSWFALDNTGEDTGAACVVNSYQLVTKGDDGGVPITDSPLVTYAEEKLTINIDATALEGSSVFMKATTNGGVSTYKEIFIKQTEDPCIYSISPEQAEITFPYSKGQKVEVIRQLRGLLKFDNGGGACNVPVDQIYTYAAQTDYPDTVASTGDLSSLDFTMTDENKGKNDFYFSVGAIGKPQKSPLAHGEIIICGKEIVSLSEGNTEPLIVEFKNGETEPRNLKLVSYQPWFKLEEGDNSSPECVIKTYGLYKETTGGDKLDGDQFAKFGINQITFNNPLTETPYVVHFEAMTNGGVSIRRPIHIFQAPESQLLVEKIQKQPEWSTYDQNNKFTKSLQLWQSDTNIGGGPLTGPLKPVIDGNVVEIQTPLKALIENTPNFGFYEIKKIQLTDSESSKFWFYDVDILATKQEDVETLKKLAATNSHKCCWWDKLQNNINGIGRVVFYRDLSGDGSAPEYAYYIWEGQFEKGLPKGFIRYIQPTRSFVGYLDNLGYTQAGTALYFKDLELVHSAVYSEGTRYRREDPEETSKKVFTEFSQE